MLQSLNLLFLEANGYTYEPSQKWNGYEDVIGNQLARYGHRIVWYDSLLISHGIHNEKEATYRKLGALVPILAYGAYPGFRCRGVD